MGLLVSSTQRAGYVFTMPLARDLLHPTAEEERRRHKLKRLVQHPNSYFMDVKCPAATGSQQCSLTRRLLWSARDAPPSSASPPGVGPGSLKAALSEGRPKSNLHLRVVF